MPVNKLGRGGVSYTGKLKDRPVQQPQTNIYQDLISGFQKREETALAANVAREQELRNIYGKQIAQYKEGGAFKAAGLATIEQAKTRAVGAGTQQMISSGLYGTTTAASIPVQAEQQAGMARLKLEDILQQRVTEAEKGLAGVIERVEQPYPDYNMLLQASIAQAEQANKPGPTHTRTVNAYQGFKYL